MAPSRWGCGLQDSAVRAAAPEAQQRGQKLIVAVVEATPPGSRVEEQRPDGTRLIVTTMAPLTGGFPAEVHPATTLTSATSISTSTTQ
jgi:hypothetical protein